MSEAPAPDARTRDSLLEALELFRELSVPRSMTVMILFLYVCENEGLNVSELALAGKVPIAAAARLAKTLAGQVPEEPVPPGSVLFEMRSTAADRRLRFVYLSARGRELRDQMEHIIARAAPITRGRAIAGAES